MSYSGRGQGGGHLPARHPLIRARKSEMSRLSYGKSDSDNTLKTLSLNQFIKQLPHVTIHEMETLADTNRHLVEQIPRYISQMVSYECRLIGF